MFKVKVLTILIISVVVVTACKQTSDKKNTVDAKVETLLSRMTLEEKVAQLQCMWNNKDVLFDEENNFSEALAKEFVPNGIGQIGRPSEGKTPLENAMLTNAIQKYFVEKTRLGIPVIFHEECLHGHAAKHRTLFAQPIGLASTWNTDLVKALYAMTAKEARAVGTHLALTPVVDVAREPRWGRVEETFGEDPYLVAQMGLAAVQGFQGEDGKVKDEHVMATLKHFAAHGQPESGTNTAPVNVSERLLREVFLYPFELCVKEGHVKNIMASYNEIDGIPSHANSWLLDTVLRKEWGFQGAVVSDYYAVEELKKRHGVVKDYMDAAVIALKAGVDVELPEPMAFTHLVKAVEEGLLEEKYVDRAVRRVLKQKFEMGLFENPYVDTSKVEDKVNIPAHHQLSLQAAEETMVLLKNESNILPLDTMKPITIAVIGPNAHRELIGGYSGEPSYFITVLDGIKKKFKNAKVVYAQGCQVTKDSVWHNGNKVKSSWYNDPVEKYDKNENLKLIKEAKVVAAKADVIILCVGGNELTSREGWAEGHLGDRTDLQMVGEQNALVEAMHLTGKPIISLLFNGKPLAVNELYQKSEALLECWYLGSECGHAVANVLSGKVSPSGKLPISFPRSVGHIPCYYNYKPTARRGYLFDDVSPLFAFGYGLSYAQFEYSEPVISKKNITQKEKAVVSVKVKNKSEFPAKEIVQLYVRDKVSSVTRPVKELKAFQKILLQPGEEKNVEFEIGEKQLSFWTINKVYAVETGHFNIYIGHSSRKEDLKKIKLGSSKSDDLIYIMFSCP